MIKPRVGKLALWKVIRKCSSASDRCGLPTLFFRRIAACRMGIGSALSDDVATDARLV